MGTVQADIRRATVEWRMILSQYFGFWAVCVFSLIVLNINKSQSSPVITDEDILREIYYDDVSPITYNAALDDDMRLVDKRSRQRQAGFSAWAGKRSNRHTQGFSSWAGKRAPFNAWTGKRSGTQPIYHQMEFER